MSRTDEITRRLEAALSPSHIEVTDESHLHVGHPGARDGRGHFKVDIVADAFAGARPIARHRMVYEALGELMKTEIHALTIDARAPDE